MKKNVGATAGSLLVGLLLSACGGGSSSDSSSPVKPPLLPSVSGPIASTATSYPFGAADHTLVPEDLKSQGYVEEEYFISGKANVYDWPAPGPAVVRTPDAPYTTRVLIRRPVDGKNLAAMLLLNCSMLPTFSI